MTSENMRREARVEVRVPVVVYRGRNAQSLETSDVSFKGLFVKTNDPPPLRSLVRLRVTLIGHSFEAHAMVVHVVAPADAKSVQSADDSSHEAGVGLQFWGLSGRDRSAWDDFVRGQRVRRTGGGSGPGGSGVHTSMYETPSGVRIVAPPGGATEKPKASGHWG